MRICLISTVLALAFLGCSSDENQWIAEPLPQEEAPIADLKPQEARRSYPWDSAAQAITKAHFRCKGSRLNPPRKTEKELFLDCGGFSEHSLPIKNGAEFIYPCLIEVLNDLQTKTGKRVVITTGHRCIQHHLYARTPEQGRASKHLIGGEVAFYLSGFEQKPEAVVELIREYYQKRFPNQPEMQKWERYEKSDTDVSMQPWYNHEVFIKIYKPHEGRDLDNRHPYPYLRIQVRYDRDSKEKVTFNWGEAEKNIYKHY